MKRSLNFFLVFLGVFISTQSFAESKKHHPEASEAIAYESTILNETRHLRIHLPKGYMQGNNKYPVLFVTDADWNFDYVTNYIEFMRDRFPHMIIVGILNTDRNRDYVAHPDSRFPGTGGGRNFLQALQEEIIPLIDTNYRTTNDRIYFGHSFGGIFGLYSLFQPHDLFDAYIVVGSSTWVADRFIFDQAEQFFSKTETMNKYLFMSVAEADGGETNSAGDAFAKLLAMHAPDSLEWYYEVIPRTTHFSAPPPSLHAALDYLFPAWNMEKEMDVAARDGGVVGINHWFEENKARLGYRFHPQRTPYSNIAFQLARDGLGDEALAIMNQLRKSLPDNPDIIANLATVYFLLGMFPEALVEIDKALLLGESQNHFPDLMARYRAFKKRTEAILTD